jgi:hypothetical protein
MPWKTALERIFVALLVPFEHKAASDGYIPAPASPDLAVDHGIVRERFKFARD